MLTDGLWQAPSATTYSLGCAPPSMQTESLRDIPLDALTECGSLTVAQGPRTWSMHWEASGIMYILSPPHPLPHTYAAEVEKG